MKITQLTKALWLPLSLACLALASCSKVVGISSGGIEGGSIQREKLNVRSYDQLNETMSALTGVPVSKVASQFNPDSGSGGLNSSLPDKNTLKEFSASKQGSIVRLATAYCDNYTTALFNNSAAQLKNDYPFFGAAFKNDVTQDFGDANVAQLTSSFYSRFWGACPKKPELSEVQGEMSSMVSGLKGQMTGNLNTPQNYFRIMCSVFLSSSCVSFY